MRKYLLIMVVMLVLASPAFVAAASSDIQVSLLKYSPYPAEPGKYLTLTFKIDNSGTSDADNVKLKFSPGYPFYFDKNATVNILNSATKVPIDSGMVAYIGSIPSSQYTTVEYDVLVDTNVFEGSRQLSIWHQAGSGDIWVEDDFDIFVQGTDRLEVSSVTPAILTPGKPTNAVFVLNNTGTASIRDVSFTWAEKSNEILPLGSGNTKYASSIAAGSSAGIPFTLVANPGATSGVYTILANITYTIGSNISKSQSVSIGMFIGGKGEFDVSTQESAAGSLTLSIANIGETTTSSVSVSIPEQDNFAVSGISSSFLGNMNPGDFLTATFQISQKASGSTGFNRSTTANRTSSGRLKVDITYTDTNGNRETIEKEVPVFSAILSASGNGLSSNTQNNFTGRNNFFGIPGIGGGGSSGSLTIVLVVVVIFIAIIIYIFRKRIFGFFTKLKKQEKK